MSICPDCLGIGGDPLGEDCPMCNGRGRIHDARETLDPEASKTPGNYRPDGASPVKVGVVAPWPRETFDPEAVRALLDLIKHAPKNVTQWLDAAAKRVRDSEKK